MIYLLKKIIKFIFFVFYLLPRGVQNFIGALFGVLWFDVLRIRRKIIMSNLDIAFPQKSKQEKVKIGRASCINLGMTYVEFMRLYFISEKHKDEFKIIGEEHLKKAEDKGKGMFILTLHMGNGDYGCAGFSMLGYPIVMISKVFKMKWVNDAWFNVRKRFGNEYIPVQNSSLKVLRQIRNKKRVVFVLDQFSFPPLGIKTKFFGKETRSNSGLAVLAQRTEAPVVPMYTYRNDKGQTEIHCLPEIPFVEKENKDATILHMTQVYQDQLEVIVKKHPDQWMWVHRRWKSY